MAAGGLILDNRWGMAPPLALELDPPPGPDPGPGATPEPRPRDRWLFVLPGVPREFQTVLEEVLIPRYFAGSRGMAVVELRYPGAIEADFAEPMQRLEREFPEVAVGSYPQQRGRDLVIRLRGEDPARVGAAKERLLELRAGG